MRPRPRSEKTGTLLNPEGTVTFTASLADFSIFFLPAEPPPQLPNPRQPPMPNLSDSTRHAIVNDILLNSKDGKLPHGICAKLGRTYGCHRHTVERVWKRYNENVTNGVIDGAPGSRIKANSGRKPYDRTELAAKVFDNPVNERRRRRSGQIKPVLTDQKVNHVRHVLSFVRKKTYEFDPAFDVVHIDEKWLNEDVDGRTYLLLPDEEAHSDTAGASASSQRPCSWLP
ncbi:hypothetical protein BBJ28_00017253 [Nothophytophthora sp. Chile5]|nr:hypothetical protein BBJ28_00017253 [Nothophytophthora sp. Chile5]